MRTRLISSHDSFSHATALGKVGTARRAAVVPDVEDGVSASPPAPMTRERRLDVRDGGPALASRGGEVRRRERYFLCSRVRSSRANDERRDATVGFFLTRRGDAAAIARAPWRRRASAPARRRRRARPLRSPSSPRARRRRRRRARGTTRCALVIIHPSLLPRISSQPFPFRRVRRGRVRAVVRRPHRRAIASHPTPSPRDAASSSASSTAVAHLPAPPPIARASSRLDPVSPPRRRSRRRRSSSRSRDRDPPSSAPSPSAASASAA